MGVRFLWYQRSLMLLLCCRSTSVAEGSFPPSLLLAVGADSICIQEHNLVLRGCITLVWSKIFIWPQYYSNIFPFPQNHAGWLWRPETSHLGRKMSIFWRNDPQKRKLGKCCSAAIPPGSSGIAVLRACCSALGPDRYSGACDGLRGLGVRCTHAENASETHIFTR